MFIQILYKFNIYSNLFLNVKFAWSQADKYVCKFHGGNFFCKREKTDADYISNIGKCAIKINCEHL